MLNNDLVKAFKIEANQALVAAAVVTKLLECKQYMDDHNRGDRIQDVSTGYVLVEYKGQLCPFPENSNGACLNPLYVGDDGNVHLSVYSIGPYYPTVEAVEEAGLNVHRFE